MNERTKTAFDFASETTKQLLTLSTAIVVLPITFSKDVIGSATDVMEAILLFSWVALLFSVLCGLWTLMALTGAIGQKDQAKDISIYDRNIANPAFLQVISFFFGLLLTIVFAAVAIVGNVI